MPMAKFLLYPAVSAQNGLKYDFPNNNWLLCILLQIILGIMIPHVIQPGKTIQLTRVGLKDGGMDGWING